MEFEGLERLEDIIGRLLSQHAELKKQNEMLAAEVEEKKQELGRINEEIREMRGDKEEVHQRVSFILNKLEEWEQTKDDAEPAGNDPSQDNPATDQESQKQLFNMGA
ncbi:MAG: cell division protein ZapB [Thermodesulfobacteriota bacterium]